MNLRYKKHIQEILLHKRKENQTFSMSFKQATMRSNCLYGVQGLSNGLCHYYSCKQSHIPMHTYSEESLIASVMRLSANIHRIRLKIALYRGNYYLKIFLYKIDILFLWKAKPFKNILCSFQGLQSNQEKVKLVLSPFRKWISFILVR